MDDQEDELFGHLFSSSSLSSASNARKSGLERTAFKTLSTKSVNCQKGPVVGQVISCRCKKVGAKKTSLFTAVLLDLSENSDHKKLGAKRVGRDAMDEMTFQAWGSDAEDYNRKVKVGDVIELLNYAVKGAYRPEPNAHKYLLSHNSWKGSHTTYHISPSGVDALTPSQILQRLYVSPVRVEYFKEWEPTEGPEKWRNYTVLGVVSFVSDLRPPSEDGKNMTRRMTIIDDRSYSINVMLIGTIAEEFTCRAGDIVMLYNFKIGDWTGRSLRCFNGDGAAVIFDAYGSRDDNDHPESDLRSKCISYEMNPFCQSDVERLKKWRAVYWGCGDSLVTNLSDRRLDADTNFEVRTLQEVEAIEVDQLSATNTGPIRHVIIGRFAELMHRNGLYNIVCSEKRCTYHANWVEAIGKWVCGNPRVSDTPRIPGVSEENRQIYRWVGHAISDPEIRYSLQVHIRDDNNDQRFAFLGNNPMKTILGGVSAEQWATGNMEDQDRWTRERLNDLSETTWKIHAMSSYNSRGGESKNPFQMRVVSIEPCNEFAPSSPPPPMMTSRGDEETTKDPRQRVFTLKRKRDNDDGTRKRVFTLKRRKRDNDDE